MIESPVVSGGGAQIGLLKLTVTLSVVNTEAAVQQAMDANAEMASPPIDPTVQLPLGLPGCRRHGEEARFWECTRTSR